MFANLFKRSRNHEVPQELYGSVVAQSRNPVFFTDFGFEDTVTGRFDLVALHLYLFSRRLVREDTSLSQSLNQEVFDQFTDDTDRALRELGVGDTSVPKRKKKMIRTFYAMVEDFSEPLDHNDIDALINQIEKRFGLSEESNSAPFEYQALAQYMMAASDDLDANPSDTIMTGQISWPDPEKFL